MNILYARCAALFAALISSLKEPIAVCANPPTAAPQLTILVADDDPQILTMVARMISRIGYATLLANDGQAAVGAAAQQPMSELACAILDVMMPGMNGIDAAVSIRTFAPNLPIILMSGYTPSHIAEQIHLLHPAHFLEKPFTVVELRAILEALLRP